MAVVEAVLAVVWAVGVLEVGLETLELVLDDLVEAELQTVVMAGELVFQTLILMSLVYP